MNDLISRKSTLKNIEKIRQSVQMMDDTHRASITMNGMYLCEKAVRNQPSAQPYTDEQIQRMQNMEQAQLDKAFELGREDAKPQWIPCSERLPEHSGWYIVTKKLTDDGDKAVCLSWYSFHGWEWGENPIAWMPLPEPYREEGDQE